MATTDPTFDTDNAFATLVDFWLHDTSNRTYAILADPHESTAIRVSFQDFARAAHNFGRWLQSHVKAGEVVGQVLLVTTLAATTATVGTARAGCAAFPISPRMSAEAICILVKSVSCHTLLVSASSLHHVLPRIRQILEQDHYPITMLELPALSELYPQMGLQSTNTVFTPLPLPSPSLYPEGAVILLHTSGSTGFPKAVRWTQKFVSTYRFTPAVEDMRRARPLVFGVNCLPPFHSMGLYGLILSPLHSGNTVVMFAPSYSGPPTPDATLQVLQQAKADVIIVPPVFVELWSSSEIAVAFLADSDRLVMFGGGPLAEAVGSNLHSRGVKLVALYGGTEACAMTKFIVPDNERHWQWQYYRFSENAQIRWEDQGDGTYELQFLTCSTHAPAVENLSDVRGFATSDLWVPNPGHPDWWKIVARKDDIIVLSNGEKVMPAVTEGIMRTHPLVADALLFGRGQEQVGLLIELKQPTPEGDVGAHPSIIDAIWPSVQEANAQASDFARILKEMILLSSPAKPMIRAAKGTVIREMTLREYEDEIRVLYATGGTRTAFPISENWDRMQAQEWLMGLVASIQIGQTLGLDDDIFSAGFDSLAAAALRHQIIGSLRNSPVSDAQQVAQNIPSDLVYSHPSVRGLLSAILARLAKQDVIVDSPDIGAMISKYSASWPSHESVAQPVSTGASVLISGTTGNLGCHLLARCLQLDNIETIYALNRPSARASRDGHVSLFKERALPVDLLQSHKIVFLESSMTQKQLGLAEQMFHEIRNSVTHIFHLAWRLDFNMTLTSFEPNIQAARHILDLALTCTHRSSVRVFFASSISIASAWQNTSRVFPEEPVLDVDMVAGIGGYGESKFVTEQILVAAARQGISTTSFRVGQTTGPRRSGVWATTEWVPIFVKTSISLGEMPLIDTDVAWISVDEVVSTMIDIGFAQATPFLAYNIVHPQPVSWTRAFGLINEALASRSIVPDPLPFVPMSEWYERLQRRLAKSGRDISQLPAARLLNFVASMLPNGSTRGIGGVQFAMQQAMEASPELKAAEPLDTPDAQAWVKYWSETGFLRRSS